MGMKTFIKKAKCKLKLTNKEDQIGADKGANRTVDDPVCGPRMREITPQSHPNAGLQTQPRSLKRHLQKKLGYYSVRAFFKIRKTKNADQSHSDESCVSAPTTSSLPRTVSRRFSSIEDDSSAFEESCIAESAPRHPVTQQSAIQNTNKALPAAHIRRRVQRLQRAASHRVDETVCAVSIAQNESKVLHPVAVHTKIAIRFHLHGLATQRLDQHQVRKSLGLLLPMISAWPLDLLGGPAKPLVDAMFQCMIRIASDKGRHQAFATCKPLSLAMSTNLVDSVDSSTGSGKLSRDTQGGLFDTEQTQASEVFFGNDFKNLIDADDAISTLANTSIESGSDNVMDPDSTSGETTESSHTQTDPSLSPDDTPPTSEESYGETSDGENISALAETYASKEAVIQDYDFVLNKQKQDHEFELQDLQESHDAKMKRAKAAHQEEIKMVQNGCQEEVRRALRRADQRAGEMREQVIRTSCDLRKVERDLSESKAEKESLENALDELQRVHEASNAELTTDERSVLEDRIESLRQKVSDTKSAAKAKLAELQGEVDRLRVLYDIARAEHFTLARCEAENGDWSDVVMKCDQQQEAAQALIISQGMHRKEEERANKLAGEVQSLERENDVKEQTIEKLEAILRGFDDNLALRREVQAVKDRSLSSLGSAHAAGKAENPSLDSQKTIVREESLLKAHQEAVITTATAQASLAIEKRERREEVSDLRRELTALRQTLCNEEVGHEEAKSEKVETAKALVHVTEYRDNLQHQVDELHRQLETRAFGPDQDVLWHQTQADLQRARDEAQDMRNIAEQTEKLLFDRETAHEMYRSEQYQFWQQMGKDHPQTKHIVDKDRYHCIILAMQKRFEAELEQKKLLVDVTDFLATYEEADVERFMEFGAMGNFVDVYCDQDRVKGSLQHDKFSEKEIEAARIAVEDVVRQNRAKEMQEARAADAKWNKVFYREETEEDNSSSGQDEEASLHTELCSIEDAEQQQSEHQGQSLDDEAEFSETSSWVDTTDTGSNVIEEQIEEDDQGLSDTPTHMAVVADSPIPTPETRIRPRSQRAGLFGGSRADNPPFHVRDLIGNYTPTPFSRRQARRRISQQNRVHEQPRSTTPPSTPPQHKIVDSEMSARLSQFDARTRHLNDAEIDYTNPYGPPGNDADFVLTEPVIGPPIVFQSDYDRQQEAQKARDESLWRQNGAF